MENDVIHIDITKRLHSASGEMILRIKTELSFQSCCTLFGPSGAGKTTLLRILAGLTIPDTGTIRFGNSVWFDSSRNINLPPQQRAIGFMFQEYALFPNMTVRKNLEYALPKHESPEIIEELMNVMEIDRLQDKKPETLSGGQQQRVALARALVRKPKLLLLDEPLSALDKEMRRKLQEYILRVHTTYQLTTILVSHDISEIIALSDTIIKLDNGNVAQQGRVSEVLLNMQQNKEILLTGKIIEMNRNGTITVQVGNSTIQLHVSDLK